MWKIKPNSRSCSTRHDQMDQPNGQNGSSRRLFAVQHGGGLSHHTVFQPDWQRLYFSTAAAVHCMLPKSVFSPSVRRFRVPDVRRDSEQKRRRLPVAGVPKMMFGNSRMKTHALPGLLSFNGGFVDTAGFLGLQGLFTAHVTGNFVTLGAALVFGTHGVIAKLIALPEFVVVVALARLTGAAIRTLRMDALRLLLVAKVTFLLAFFALGVALGPFPDSDSPAALLTGFAGIAGMAIQNAVQRVHFAHIPPTTLMTGNTTQAVLDAVDLARGAPAPDTAAVRVRFLRTLRGIVWFAAGCAIAALLYYWFAFWCLAVPVAVAAATAILRDDGGPSQAATPQAVAKGP
jgi:uncharacterized membrane protein YoaK (UPF0700 family)